jgi:hypothetical protein
MHFGANRQNLARRVTHHCLSHASQQHTREAASAVRAHDNQVDVLPLCIRNNL